MVTTHKNNWLEVHLHFFLSPDFGIALKRLAVRLAETKCKWLLSSYDMPEVRQMYAGYDIIPIQSYSGMNSNKNGSERVLNQEVVIANFNTQTADLLYPQGGQLALQRPLLKLEEPNPEFEIDPKGY